MTSMHRARIGGIGLLVVLAAATVHWASTGARPALAGPAGQSFASPEAAAKALADACEKNDSAALAAIFGPGSEDIVSTGDSGNDAVNRRKFAAMIRQAVKTEPSADGSATVLVVGFTAWPFPVPLVKSGDGWQFDLAAAREEILARRVGQDELAAIEICRAFGPAERAYALADRDGDGCNEYAQRLVSTEGQMDGLYWPEKPGAELSPFGDLVAAAGDAAKEHKAGEPWKGYRFRILFQQGPNAPGGAFSYLGPKGDLIGGYALLAWPAEHRKTGVMTFIVGREGLVYQKDLGEHTEEAGGSMLAFDPDASWTLVPEGHEADAPAKK